MVLLKLKALQSQLEDIDDFEDPKLQLEQYMTRPHIAAHMLYSIELEHGDIEGLSVVDLGCGTGMLSIAAALLGASYCLGVDMDGDALEVFQRNVEGCEVCNVVDVLQCNVRQLLQQLVNQQQQQDPTNEQQQDPTNEQQQDINNKQQKQQNYAPNEQLVSHPWFQNFDTGIMNPPFGTKQIKNIDLEFVKLGMQLCRRAVYSLHKSSHLRTVEREMKKIGVKTEAIKQVSFDLPNTYKNHRKKSVDVGVVLLRFTKSN